MNSKGWRYGRNNRWLGLLGSFFLSTLANASVVTQLRLEELARRADHAFVGTVEAVNPHFLDHSSLIVTDVQIRCTEGLWGVPAGSVFTVRHMGGEVDGWGQKVFGEASYRVGEEVVLLAEPRQGHFFAVGMAQGVFHVVSRDGKKRVRLALSGATLQPIRGDKTPASIDDTPLAEVLTQLRGFFAARSSQPLMGASSQGTASASTPSQDP